MRKNTLLRVLPVLALLVLIPVMALAAGGNAEDPGAEQLKTYIAEYQLCFFKALPQAMADLGDNTPNEALADKALDACSDKLDELRAFLVELWEEPKYADAAVKQVRATTRELALKDFELAKKNYPQVQEQMKASQ